MSKISVVLATRNEEKNIGRCLDAVQSFADEIIVVDEESSDRTREIAKEKGAVVHTTKHEEIFHKTKQKALDLATGDWILQLDADEVVTPELAKEIVAVSKLSNDEILKRRPRSSKKWSLFQRHQVAYEKMNGLELSFDGEVVAFWLPRVNYFINKKITHAGVYPDPAIRLVKKGRASFPAISVHENMKIDGSVAWLFEDLEHHDSPTISRYIMRMNRYTDLQAEEFNHKKLPKNYLMLFYYSVIKPKISFISLYYRHRGYKDGLRGFLWSAFSSMHFPLSYYKYWTNSYTK